MSTKGEREGGGEEPLAKRGPGEGKESRRGEGYGSWWNHIDHLPAFFPSCFSTFWPSTRVLPQRLLRSSFTRRGIGTSTLAQQFPLCIPCSTSAPTKFQEKTFLTANNLETTAGLRSRN